jgi:nitrate/nitrite transporter NarK
VANRYNLGGDGHVCHLWSGTFERLEKETGLVCFMVLAITNSFSFPMSMGTLFYIVPYVLDGPNTGTIAGIVGAGCNVGGNVGAVLFLNVFKSH